MKKYFTIATVLFFYNSFCYGHWLESPVSKKFQQVDGEIANTLAQKVVADTRGAVETRLKTLETSLAKKLGVPVPPNGGGASGPKK